MRLLDVAKKISPIINYFPFFNRLRFKRGNKVKLKGVLLIRCQINLCGTGNEIEIENGTVLYKTKIDLSGSGNVLHIGHNCVIKHAEFVYEDDNNMIEIGNETRMMGRLKAACLEAKKIIIGEGCLFSSQIEIRTSDSHSILNKNRERINCAESISIGDRVWCGQGVYILKGSRIGNDCVIGAGSIVNKNYQDTNCIIAGIPAKIVKRDIAWQKERI